MKERYFLLWCVIAAATGIAGAGIVEAPLAVSAALCAGLGAAAGASFLWGRRGAAWVLCLLFVCAAGWFRMELAGSAWQRESHGLSGASGTWSLVISGEALPVKGADSYIRYPAEGKSLRYADGTVRDVRGQVYLYVPWDGLSAPLPPDTALAVQGKLSKFRFYKNPGKIDLPRRYQAERLIGRIYIEEKEAAAAEGKAGVFPVEALAHDVKEGLRRSFAPFMDPPRLSLLMTLLFGGNYQGLPEGALEDFTRIGIVHILSVSGSHIALLFGFLCLAGRWMRLPERAVFPAAVMVILCYAGLSGFVPPVVRASLMGIFSAMGLLFHREKEGILLLSAALLCMLFYEPLYLYDVSFQLSAGASAGILLFYRPLLALCAGTILPRWASESMAVAIAAQLLTVPVVLYHFHVLPVYFLPANLFVTPLLEWTIIGGLAAALLIGAAAPLAAGLLSGADWLLWGALRLAEGLAALPGASFQAGGLLWAEACLYYALLFFLFLLLYGKRRLAQKAALCLFPPLLLWNGWAFWNRPDTEWIVPDLGASRGAVLWDGHHHILYYKEGTLPIDMGGRELLSVLGYKGIFSIDLLLLDLTAAKGTSPFSLAMPVREIWLDPASQKKAGAFLAAHPESRVRSVESGFWKTTGGLGIRKEGASYLLTKNGASWYLDGGGPVMDRPGGALFYLGGAGSFQSTVNDGTMKVLRPDAVVYSGNGTPQAGEDRDYFLLHEIPYADPSLDGMVTVRQRGKAWQMDTYLGGAPWKD